MLRADARTLHDIAEMLGVAKSSVSVWVREVEIDPLIRRAPVQRRPHPQHLAKLAQIEACDRLGLIGVLSDEAFLVAGAALFAIDEARLRMRVYLHEVLDLDAAEQFWSGITKVPRVQFRAPYRAKADPTIRMSKHDYGCAYVRYACSRTHREVMGLVRALLSSEAIPG